MSYLSSLDIRHVSHFIRPMLHELDELPFYVPYLSLFYVFYFIFEKERQSVNRGGQRERKTQNRKQAPDTERVCTEPDAGLEPTNPEITIRAQVRRFTN